MIVQTVSAIMITAYFSSIDYIIHNFESVLINRNLTWICHRPRCEYSCFQYKKQNENYDMHNNTVKVKLCFTEFHELTWPAYRKPLLFAHTPIKALVTRSRAKPNTLRRHELRTVFPWPAASRMHRLSTASATDMFYVSKKSASSSTVWS